MKSEFIYSSGCGWYCEEQSDMRESLQFCLVLVSLGCLSQENSVGLPKIQVCLEQTNRKCQFSKQR